MRVSQALAAADRTSFDPSLRMTRTLGAMSVTVDLPDDALRRLEAEAARRGVTIDDIIAELAARLPDEDPLESFIGCGASGDSEPFDIHRARDEMASAKLTDPA